MKVICAVVLCIVICPHTHTHIDTYARRHTDKCYALPVAAAAVVVISVVFVVHGGMRAVSSSQKIIHMSPIAVPLPSCALLHTIQHARRRRQPLHHPICHSPRGARALYRSSVLSLSLSVSHSPTLYLCCFALPHLFTSQLWLMLCERN